MSLKDIEKLKEKVDKDPNSKLFVPLAEEYRKEGMLDEAINVLLKGIERQPSYMSARVSLGKIYVEKEMLPEARAEFENVIKSIPDNLYAHKKLAEIYRDTGQHDMAVKAYKTVLRLNAMDEDAQANLSFLEGAAAPEPEPAADLGPAAEEISFEEPVAAEVREETTPAAGEAPVVAPPVSQEELEAFKSSLFGEETASSGEEAIALAEEEEIGIMEEADEGGISFGDINDALQEAGVEVESPAVEEELVLIEEPAAPQAPRAVPAAPSTTPALQVSAVSEDSMEEADRLVGDGDYSGAAGIYRRMLETNPNDLRVLQRVEELKTLLKLMGKDKEVLMGRLNAFLEGIRKRRDEFYGNS